MLKVNLEVSIHFKIKLLNVIYLDRTIYDKHCGDLQTDFFYR